MEKIIIIGAGGFAKSVVDSLNSDIYNLIGFIDDYKEEKEHLGYPIYGKNIDSLDDENKYSYFVAIGDNKKRIKWFDELKKRNLSTINVIDRTAIISPNSHIGTGCFVGKMAIVNSGTDIGDNCIINTKALVEHGCHIGNNVNVSTNTVLNGDVVVGDRSFIGSCSVVNGQIIIGSDVMVGSGSVVVRNVEDNTTVVGAPARLIKRDGIRI